MIQICERITGYEILVLQITDDLNLNILYMYYEDHKHPYFIK